MKARRKHHAARWTAIYAAIVTLGLSACDSELPETITGPVFVAAADGAWEKPVPSPIAAALDAAFARAHGLSATNAMTVAVRSGRNGKWQAGTDQNADRFWWASTGKLVTTVLALQEVEAGHVSLDSVLTPVLPIVPSGVTLRHLLTHTSGIADFTRIDLLADQFGLADRQALIRAALDHEHDFPPGKGWAYSNTGFLLVQELLEAISGKSYETLVETRISEPLGLTSFAAPSDEIPPDVVLPELGTPRPASEFPPNIGGAGSVVATSADIARFWQAAMAGTLVGPKMLNEALTTLYPFFGSRAMQMGAGIIVFPTSDDSGYWLGHGGGAEQVAALALYSPSRQMVIAVAGIGPDLPAMDVANIIIETMDKCEESAC